MAGDPGFKALTLQADSLISQLITEFKVSVPFDPHDPPDPLPATTSTTALWDTGASKSIISHTIVKDLALIPTGETNVRHAGGTSVSPTHLVNLYLPNQVGIGGVLVTEFEGRDDFGAIVGMDVITFGDFSVTNVAGRTCMSFRTPSMASIDYVQDHTREIYRGVGRNDQCPCGSGKKFKRCHGAA